MRNTCEPSVNRKDVRGSRVSPWTRNQCSYVDRDQRWGDTMRLYSDSFMLKKKEKGTWLMIIHRACCEQFHVRTPPSALWQGVFQLKVNIFHIWSCEKQPLWIILREWVINSVNRHCCWVFPNVFFGLYYIQEKTDISQAWPPLQIQSTWINSNIGSNSASEGALAL